MFENNTEQEQLLLEQLYTARPQGIEQLHKLLPWEVELS
jgi:hypothetical protein